MPSNNRPTVPAVQRATRILDLLARQSEMSLSRISGTLGLPKSSVFNLLTSLEEARLVERHPDTGRYSLGMHLLVLAGALQSRIDVRQAAQPELRELAEDTEETTHLGILEKRDLAVIYIDKVDSPQAVKLASYVGRMVPAHCTALGKVLLAGLDPSELRAALDGRTLAPSTPNTITDPGALMAEIDAVRRQGYGLDLEEHEHGVRCMAAPIRRAGGEVVAAVSVAGPASRLTSERLDEWVPRVQAAAAAISRRMGFVGPDQR